MPQAQPDYTSLAEVPSKPFLDELIDAEGADIIANMVIAGQKAGMLGSHVIHTIDLGENHRFRTPGVLPDQDAVYRFLKRLGAEGGPTVAWNGDKEVVEIKGWKDPAARWRLTFRNLKLKDEGQQQIIVEFLG